jgi:hypothetical protein
MKILPAGLELLHAYRWTDRQRDRANLMGLLLKFKLQSA